MVRLIKLYLPALFKKFFLFYFVMLLLSGLAVSLFTSAISAHLGFDEANRDFVNTYCYPDIIISSDFTNIEKLNVVESVNGINQVSYRASFLCDCKYNSKLLTSRIISIDENSIIKLYLVDGVLNDEGIYIERNYAENNNIVVGDIVSIKYYDEYIDCKVVALVQSTETTFFSLTTFLSADNIDSGAIYLSDNYYKEILTNIYEEKGITKNLNSYNEILINIKEDGDVNEVLTDCLTKLNDINVIDSQIKDNASCIKSMSSYLKTISKISILVPAIFYVVMLIITLLFYMQIIKNSYKNIGILMMQGYQKEHVIFLFQIASFIVSVLSIGLGLYFGRYLLKFLVYIYGRHHIIPYVYEKYNMSVVIIAIIFTVLVSQLACLLSLLLLKNVSPKQVVDNDFNATFKSNSKLGSRDKKISNLAIYNALAISSLKANLRRFVVSIFVFMVCFTLMFLSYSINISNDTVLDQYCNNLLNYDAMILLVEDNDEASNLQMAKEQLDTYQEQLSLANEQLNDSLKQLNLAKEKIDKVVENYNTGLKEYNESQEEYSNFLNYYETSYQAVNKALNTLNTSLDYSLMEFGTFADVYMQDVLDVLFNEDACKALYGFIKEIDENKYKSIITDLAEYKEEYCIYNSSIFFKYPFNQIFDYYQLLVDFENEILNFSKNIYENYKQELTEKLNNAQNLLSETSKQINDYKAQYNDGLKEYQNKLALYEENVSLFNDKQKEYDELAQKLLNKEVEDVYDGLIKLDIVKQAEIGGICTVKIENEENTVVKIFANNHELVGITSKDNDKFIDVNNEGIIIDQSVAEKLNVKIGDEITLNNSKVKISDFSTLYQGKCVVMSFEMAEDLGLDYYDVIYLNCDDIEQLKDYLHGENISSYVINSENIRMNAYKSSSSYTIFTNILIAFSIIIGLVVISIMNISSFNEQKRRLSIMRILGFRISQVSLIWFIQFIICFVIGIILAIPLANRVSSWFMNLISGSKITYPFVNDYRLYLYPILLILLFYIIAHYISMYCVIKFNLAENTRSRE